MIYTRELYQKFVEKEKLDKINSTKKRRKRISSFIRYITFAFLGKKWKWEPATLKIKAENIKNILILRYDAIGDYIVTTSAIRWLKDACPHANIDIVCSERNKSLAEIDPNVNNIYILPYKKKFWRSLIKIKKQIGNKKYDLTLALVYTKMTACAILSRCFASDSEKITILHTERPHIYGLVFNRQEPSFYPGKSWAERFVLMMKNNITSNIPIDEKEEKAYICVSKKSLENISNLLEKHDLSYDLRNKKNVFSKDDVSNFHRIGKQRYFIINISAYSPNRMWGTNDCSNFIINCLKQYPNTLFFVSGGPQFIKETEEIIRTVNHKNCIALNLPLLDYIAFVGCADLIITPDTSIAHIGAAFEVPLVILYAEEVKIIDWFPQSERFLPLLSADKEKLVIKTEKIIEAVEMILSDSPIEVCNKIGS